MLVLLCSHIVIDTNVSYESINFFITISINTLIRLSLWNKCYEIICLLVVKVTLIENNDSLFRN